MTYIINNKQKGKNNNEKDNKKLIYMIDRQLINKQPMHMK